MLTVGVVGLGKMGHQIVTRLLQAGITPFVFDVNQEAVTTAVGLGAVAAASLSNLAEQCSLVWLMTPAGNIVDDCISELLPPLKKGSIIIDGGNSFYKDSIRRHNLLAQHGIAYLDCGTSGGKHGTNLGFSLMIGGERDAFVQAQPVLHALAAPNGYALVGPSGAGHYVKMVHNGLEYALLQAYGEGFHLLREGQYKDLDLATISEIWLNGSIVRSWILELAHAVFVNDQRLEGISGFVAENQTGRWTLDAAHEAGIPTKQLEDALAARAWSRETGGNFATKVVAMLRNQFGGHAVKEKP